MRTIAGGLCITVAAAFVLVGCSQDRRNGTPAVSESPSQEPESETFIPRDLDDCFVQLEKLLTPADLEAMRRGTEDAMARYHWGLGSWIRSTWLDGDSPLTKWFTDQDIYACDDMSGIILDSFWRHLHGQDLRLQQQIEICQAYGREAERRRRPVPVETFELIDAMAAHDLERVKSLIEKGANVNDADHRGQRLLTKAIESGDLNMVRCLVEHGANVNARAMDAIRRRPVVLDAVGGGNLEILRYLVEQGADITAADEEGRNAVIEAVVGRKLEMLKYLVEERGMNINRPDERGHVPIIFLYEQLDEPDAYEVLQYAIDKGANINARDFDGITLLARAKQCHNDRILTLLQVENAR